MEGLVEERKEKILEAFPGGMELLGKLYRGETIEFVNEVTQRPWENTQDKKSPKFKDLMEHLKMFVPDEVQRLRIMTQIIEAYLTYNDERIKELEDKIKKD